MIVISGKRNWTMPLAVASMTGEKTTEVGYQFALASISAIPMIAIFLAFQKYFITGITMGAVKG
jgi:multiple sugar transport system permease protein